MKKNALISVYDKDKILKIASFLEKNDYQIISTGGSFNYLRDNGLHPKKVSEITGFEEILDGRVKTLHPNIHSGILFRRNDKNHVETMAKKNISSIDIVIVNLYPFFENVSKDLSDNELVEFIDIGGPTMLRSAAKSYNDVTVITDKGDYSNVINEILENGKTSFETRKKLAGKVFNLTSTYDAVISKMILGDNIFDHLNMSYKKKMNLRYGENPHQKAAYYTSIFRDGAMRNFEQLSGKQLSFNNIRDMDVAWKIVNEFDQTACCALKHSTPCGVALGDNVLNAYKKVYECDKISIFGGIVSFNKTVTKDVSKELIKLFLEIIIAPSFDDEALEILKKKKNLRLIKITHKISNKHEIITVDGGVLVQSCNFEFSKDLKFVTKTKVNDAQKEDLSFAQKVVKHAKSNAIVIAKNKQTLGISSGQTNRIWAAQEAISRALKLDNEDLVMASDAFFPFSDVVDFANENGVKIIIQPGGSIRDNDSIEKCDEYGIAMVFTGMRHFKY